MDAAKQEQLEMAGYQSGRNGWKPYFPAGRSEEETQAYMKGYKDGQRIFKLLG